MKNKANFLILLLIVTSAANTKVAIAEDASFSGNASWYGKPFHGKKTASGEIFDMNKLSGAHKTLPLMSKVLVENPKNGKSVVVKVNDRGPFVKTRVMDLSRQGADNLGYLSHGTARLDFTPIGKNGKSAESAKDSTDAKPKSDESKPKADAKPDSATK